MAYVITESSFAPMKRSEARQTMVAIRAGMRECRLLLLDLYERHGWRALGYSSWRECCSVEFEACESQLYRLLQAAQVDRDLAQGGEELPVGGIPERHARELSKLPTAELRREVYAEAGEDGPVTAGKIAEIIDERERQSRCEKARIVNERPKSAAVETRPAPPRSNSRDPIAVILLRCEDARRYHRDLGDRSGPADEAMDEYLRIVRGK